MSASTLLRSILLITVLLGSAYLFHVPNTYAAPCAKYTSGSAVPAGYGASYDLWNLTNGSLLNTDCTASTFSIQVGNGDTTTANFAVYKTGYRWTGNTWQAITFVPDGSSLSGNYILGKAKNESALSYIVKTFERNASGIS